MFFSASFPENKCNESKTLSVTAVLPGPRAAKQLVQAPTAKKGWDFSPCL